MSLTHHQTRMLDYLRRVGGRAQLAELPSPIGGSTITTMALRGLVSVHIGLTGKGMAELERKA